MSEGLGTIALFPQETTHTVHFFSKERHCSFFKIEKKQHPMSPSDAKINSLGKRSIRN